MKKEIKLIGAGRISGKTGTIDQVKALSEFLKKAGLTVEDLHAFAAYVKDSFYQNGKSLEKMNLEARMSKLAASELKLKIKVAKLRKKIYVDPSTRKYNKARW